MPIYRSRGICGTHYSGQSHITHTKHSKNPAYRADIDGLRALAVLAVVVYHFMPEMLPGGFIGVDIFFVISGYLISGLLIQAFEQRTFSLVIFYQRRIRRIFPALLLVLVFAMVVGWLLLFPFEYRNLAKHVAASAGFLQNFALLDDTGYFDTQAIQKPLLHLWSLAVEEQFYIFWPLILWATMRLRWRLSRVIGVIMLASFIVNLSGLWLQHPAAIFYSPASRAWELMAGAWVAAAQHQNATWLARHTNIQSFLGSVLVFLGFLVIRPNMGFPGVWGMLPVAGSMLLINAGQTSYVNQRLLSVRPAVWLGLISYPLYLWHWVFWSMLMVLFGNFDPWIKHSIKAAVIVASILCAWATYRYLECYVRRHTNGRHALMLVVLATVVGVSGLAVYRSNGAVYRPGHLYVDGTHKYLNSIKRSQQAGECSRPFDSPEWPAHWNCVIGDPNANTWVGVLGDSHAISMFPALDKYGEENGVKIVYAGQNSCLGLLDAVSESRTNTHENACMLAVNKMAVKAKNQGAAAIVLVQRWSSYAVGGLTRPDETGPVRIAKLVDHGIVRMNVTGSTALETALNKTLAYYQSLAIPVLLLEDNPQQEKPVYQAQARLRFLGNIGEINENAVTYVTHRKDQHKINKLIETIAASYPSSSVLNTDPALCIRDMNTCPWVMDGKSLYYNDDHLSVAGAMRVYPLLAKRLDKILGLE